MQSTRKSRPERSKTQVAETRRALDPFFVFTYTLLALAAAIQFFLMLWMDLF